MDVVHYARTLANDSVSIVMQEGYQILEVYSERKKTVAILHVSSVQPEDKLCADFLRLANSECELVEFDLRGVVHFDSWFLRILLKLHKSLQERSIPLQIRASANLQEELETTKLNRLFVLLDEQGQLLPAEAKATPPGPPPQGEGIGDLESENTMRPIVVIGSRPRLSDRPLLSGGQRSSATSRYFFRCILVGNGWVRPESFTLAPGQELVLGRGGPDCPVDVVIAYPIFSRRHFHLKNEKGVCYIEFFPARSASMITRDGVGDMLPMKGWFPLQIGDDIRFGDFHLLVEEALPMESEGQEQANVPQK